MSTIGEPLPTTHHDYRKLAETLAADMARSWQTSDSSDVAALAQAVHARLVEEASSELRQVLTHLQGQLELARLNVERGRPALAAEKLPQLEEAVRRATSVVDVCLDRNAATKLLIRLDREEFDLGDALREFMRYDGIPVDRDLVDVLVQQAPVHADRAKLVGVLGHLVSRFFHMSTGDQKVVVSISTVGGQVEGFIGLRPSHITSADLMDELTVPMEIQDLGVDTAFTRAVVERHDGILFVATAGPTAVGFGFSLPKAPLTEVAR